MPPTVYPIPILEDNYCYLVTSPPPPSAPSSTPCFLVDPAEPTKVHAFLESFAAEHTTTLNVTHILTTHHHWDHAGGNELMLSLLGLSLGCAVVGGAPDSCAACTHPVADGQVLPLNSYSCRALITPGHTRGHACYHVTGGSGDAGAVFTGDCLFVGGCGKLFEGTAADMCGSLARLAALPGACEVFCGHEYTRGNYAFAASVEPGNGRLRERAEWAAGRDRTVPSTVAEELRSNVFVRCAVRGGGGVGGLEELVGRLGLGGGCTNEELVGACRNAKDNFKKR